MRVPEERGEGGEMEQYYFETDTTTLEAIRMIRTIRDGGFLGALLVLAHESGELVYSTMSGSGIPTWYVRPAGRITGSR